VRVDLLYTLVNPENQRPWTAVLEDARSHAQLADEGGFDGFWIGEHHFDAEGMDQCPNPVLLCADVASRARRMRIGTASVNLTLWHPLRAAEDLAMVDHMTGGRLDVALGRGIVPRDILNLNPQADRSAGDASKKVFAEHLAILRRAWTEDPFSWDGDHYTFPHPDLKARRAPGNAQAAKYVGEHGRVTGLAVLPRPLQQPTPPLFTVSESADGFATAARSGIRAITWLPTGDHLDELLIAYQDAAREADGRELARGEDCAALRIFLVAPTDDEARRLAEPAIERLFHGMTEIRGPRVWGHDAELGAGEKPFDYLMERDHLLIGSPESVAERLTRLADAHGVQHWLLQPTLPWFSQEAITQSISLFAEAGLGLLGRTGAAR
jgi:alkanesulfonate monooxygenase SsuD/methylene tetrahydromethanopterin reductase-like flavin-dependent oxidoreductase (luciferase family)